MTLQSSGPIDFGQINIELGLPVNTQISLGDGISRSLSGLLSGTVGMNSFYNKSIVSIATDSAAMNAIVANPTAMNAIAANSTAMNAIAASGLALNIIIKSNIAKTALISNQTVMNSVKAIMVATINRETSYFKVEGRYRDWKSTVKLLFGSATSYVYLYSTNDTNVGITTNWASAKHSHNNVELLHPAFPSGATYGLTTINLFAIGGLSLSTMGTPHDSLTSDCMVWNAL